MNCIFCSHSVSVPAVLKHEDNYYIHENKNNKILVNEHFLEFFCRTLGIEQSSLPSITDSGCCKACYLIYNDLKFLHTQLEDIRVKIERDVKELKERVSMSSERETESPDEGCENESAEYLVVKNFRNNILISMDTTTLIEILMPFNEAVKTEDKLIKSEPSDLNDEHSVEELLEIVPNFPKAQNEMQKTSMQCKRSVRQTGEANLKKRERNLASNKRNINPPKAKKSKQCPETDQLCSKTKKSSRKPKRISFKNVSFSTSDDVNDKVANYDNEVEGDENTAWSDQSVQSSVKFPCPICQKCFAHMSLLNRHKAVVHEKQRPFVCPVCSKGFARKNVYNMHLIQTHETEQKPHSCSVCKKKFTLEILRDRHEAFHELDSTKPLACPHCDVRFASQDQSGLGKHIELTHTKKPNPFFCDQCNMSFQNRNLKLRHDNQVHLDKFTQECNKCDKRYSIKSFLVTHMKTHSKKGPYQCAVCRWEVLTAELLSEHLLSHTGEKRLKCNECEERFFSMAELKRHGVHEHGAEKTFECNLCKKRFILNSDRAAHIREVHGGVPNQCICSQCGKGFSNSKYLKNHVRKVHELKKVVVCEICGKRLADTSSLRDHMNSHEGIKPFECPHCGQKFVKKNTLKCHILTHTGEKPFVCQICNKAYTQSHCLKTHMKSHSNKDVAKSKATPPKTLPSPVSQVETTDSLNSSSCAVSTIHQRVIVTANNPHLNKPFKTHVHKGRNLCSVRPSTFL